VTFLQRFGGALQLNVHYHVIVIEGVFLDRSDQGLKPRFIKVEPPSDADVAAALQKISRRVMRKLRQLGYLEAAIDAAMATGYDPLLDSEPELDRTMAASVKQRIAFGESGPDSTCDGLARALGMKGNAPPSRVPAVPVSMGFRCTPTPRFRRLGVTSWSA
jgi:hypothetical protein